jgi:hypothetical protein
MFREATVIGSMEELRETFVALEAAMEEENRVAEARMLDLHPERA